VHALLILGAILVLGALGDGTTSGHAQLARRALGIGGAGLATVGLANLTLRALRGVLAVAGNGVAATCVALTTLTAVTRVAALLALARHTEFLVLAILVGVAGGVFGLAPGRPHDQKSAKTSKRQCGSHFFHSLPSCGF
jgi:hypothetical protein